MRAEVDTYTEVLPAVAGDVLSRGHDAFGPPERSARHHDEPTGGDAGR